MAWKVWTTLEQTKEVAYEAAQGALDLVAEKNYVKKSDIDDSLSTESVNSVQNKVITTELNKKVEVEVISNNLIFK